MSDHLYVGQIPEKPLTVTVKGADLDPYDVDLLMTNPLGDPVLMTGTVTTDGEVLSYAWPTTSPFTMVGDYTIQLRLLSEGVVDYTTSATIEVYRPEAAP